MHRRQRVDSGVNILAFSISAQIIPSGLTGVALWILSTFEWLLQESPGAGGKLSSTGQESQSLVNSTAIDAPADPHLIPCSPSTL
jgi:hypothetical protein